VTRHSTHDVGVAKHIDAYSPDGTVRDGFEEQATPAWSNVVVAPALPWPPMSIEIEAWAACPP